MAVDEVTPSDAQSEVPEGAPRRRRFRWGCFFVINLITGALVLIGVLLFWPVPEASVRKEVSGAEKRTIDRGGARIRVTNLQDIGSPNFDGPGNDGFTQMLVEAEVTNSTEKEHLLDTSLMQFRDGYRKAYAPHLPLTQKWMRENNMEDPWDAPVRPGEKKKVALVFVIFKTAKERRLYVRRGFDWNSQEYYRIPLPADRSKRTFVPEEAASPAGTTVNDVGASVNLEPKQDMK